MGGWRGVRLPGDGLRAVQQGGLQTAEGPLAFSSPDMDATYRPMYSSDVPLDPLDMHMEIDPDYPIDTYSDGLRPPYPAGDHVLA